MSIYLKEHSFGEIIRNTFSLYFKNFLRIVFAYFLLVYPFQILTTVGVLTETIPLVIIGVLLTFIGTFFGMAVVTLLVSDLCLGNEPSLKRYFKRSFGAMLGKLIATELLEILIIGIGLILLVVPGIIFTLWFLFAVSIVVLEDQRAVKALKRSKALGKGFHMRNFGILFVMFVISLVIGGILGGTIGTVILSTLGPDTFQLFIDFIQTVFAPLGVCAAVLMYYDLRVRKEAYNSEVLDEELRR